MVTSTIFRDHESSGSGQWRRRARFGTVWWGASALLAACHATTPRTGDTKPSPPASSAASPGSAPPPLASVPPVPSGSASPATSPVTSEYTVAKQRLVLRSDETKCTLTVDPSGADVLLELDVAPPCYLLTWQHPRPPKGDSGATSLGEPGEPVAWKFPDLGNAVGVAVIGDAVPKSHDNDQLAALRARGYRCRGSIQGVLLTPGKARLAKKRDQVGLFCVETSIDLKEMWLSTHE